MSYERLLVLSPYWDFWEKSVGPELAVAQAAIAADTAALLGDPGPPAAIVVDGPGQGESVAAAARERGAEGILVVQSMAVPPAWAWEAIAALSELPVVVYAAYRQAEVLDSFGHGDITSAGATVGSAQLVNVLCREGRAHELIVGRLGDPEAAVRLGGAVRAALAASRMSRALVARIGRPQEGYACVDIDAAALRAATGIELDEVGPQLLRDAYLEVDGEAEAELRDEVEAGFELDADLEADGGLARSLRLAAALARLDRERGWAAGAINCHVPEIRYAEDPGVTPCFALGRETSRGTPWACTGDVPTAIAMLAAKSLGRPSLYHELEALDEASDELVIANSGEHDLGWAREGARPRLRRNGWFVADPRCGACAAFPGRPGPASLIAFTPHAGEPSGFRFIVAEGELDERSFPETGTANGAFRFAGGEPVAEAFRRWCAAGPPHHSCCTSGHVGAEIEALARFLGVGCTRVS